MLNALIGACRIGVCNINPRFNSSNDAEVTNFIDIIYSFIVVFKPFGGFINVIKALIFRFIISEKIDFEGWNILNSYNLEFNNSSVNIVI